MIFRFKISWTLKPFICQSLAQLCEGSYSMLANPFPPKKNKILLRRLPTHFFLKHWNQQDSLKRISPETHRKNGRFQNFQAFLGQKGRNLSGVGAKFIFQVGLMCFVGGRVVKNFPLPQLTPYLTRRKIYLSGFGSQRLVRHEKICCGATRAEVHP